MDRTLFLFINDLNNPILDSVMIVISEKATWIPLYLGIIGFLIYRYGKKTVTIVVTIAILITAVDQFCSQLVKPTFERNRPCNARDLQPYIHVPDGCGGQYGFVSNHAANCFALATFMFLMFNYRHPKVKWLFIWAGIVGLSRIYLAAHYPADIAGGAMVGISFATLAYYFYTRVATIWPDNPFILVKALR